MSTFTGRRQLCGCRCGLYLRGRRAIAIVTIVTFVVSGRDHHGRRWHLSSRHRGCHKGSRCWQRCCGGACGHYRRHRCGGDRLLPGLSVSQHDACPSFADRGAAITFVIMADVFSHRCQQLHTELTQTVTSTDMLWINVGSLMHTADRQHVDSAMKALPNRARSV